ncbi:MAG: NAD(P)-binding domain-containing protein [Vicinamibacterales bacterium]
MTAPRPAITLIGAGGKMGCRLTDNFLKDGASVSYVETATQGLERLRERGVATTTLAAAVPGADVVILAVPDVVMGEMARQVVAAMKPGSLLLTLDPAAPLDGQIPHRADIGCVVTHPSHPSIFNWEPTGRRHQTSWASDGIRDRRVSARRGMPAPRRDRPGRACGWAVSHCHPGGVGAGRPDARRHGPA